MQGECPRANRMDEDRRLCKEEDVGYVDLWDSFVGKEEMYLRDGLHLSGKGAAVFCRGTLRGGCQWLG